ncbi:MULTISPECIES: hypothetical protein [unclassified Microbacterium]|uniref:hypothetical protein n=1 Tax=unclassified Microbacterium TaxID=2609290 RepID=UPI000EA8FE20|nr:MULTISPECIES: hypothetical protein [unclassified Microbacterium]MBT2485797.1 hypothetical protein [Microbacterium sp. ISL-108]RKN68559.1 hypothetical protein D7252_13855 [Microbacterium sp. CGR2]
MSTMEDAEAAWPRYRDTHPANNTPEQRHAFIAGYFAARVVAEEPEWEYGWVARFNASGSIYEELEWGSREQAEQSIRERMEWEVDQDEDLRLVYELVKRVPAVKPGPWVPVNQEHDQEETDE